MIPGQGPHKKKPSSLPPTISGQEGRWEEFSDGWLAFYSNVGPGKYYSIPHPTDPTHNWWGASGNSGHWACRHGWMAGFCKDEMSCGERPDDTPISDEEVEAVGKSLADLLSSMESKQR